MNNPVVFADSLRKGLDCERVLDSFFRRIYRDIDNVSSEEQLSGLDRIFTNASGVRVGVEYKADLRAATTGNVFVELLHYRESDGLIWSGWGLRSKADYFALYLPGIEDCHWVAARRLHHQVLNWNAKYQKRDIFNQGKPGKPSFRTQGVLVPVRMVAAIADRIYKISEVAGNV